MARRRLIPALLIHAEWPCEDDDSATVNMRQWARRIRRDLRATGRFRVMSLMGTDVTAGRVTAALKRIQGRKGLVVFYGHGSLCGECLMESKRGTNPTLLAAINHDTCDLLTGKIVYVVACHSAKALGPLATNSGALSFIGYDDEITSGGDGKSPEGFEQAANAGIRVLIEPGRSVADAWGRIWEEYTKWVQKWLHKNRFYAFALYSNRNALSRPYGSVDASLP